MSSSTVTIPCDEFKNDFFEQAGRLMMYLSMTETLDDNRLREFDLHVIKLACPTKQFEAKGLGKLVTTNDIQEHAAKFSFKRKLASTREEAPGKEYLNKAY